MSAANSTSTISACVMCSSTGTLACAGCHSIRYCSKTCQKADWKLHKLLCKTFQNFNDSARPQDDDAVYRRAILFSDNEDSPRWYWLRVCNANGLAGMDFNDLPVEHDLVPDSIVMFNMILQRRLDRATGLVGQPGSLSTADAHHMGQKNQSFLKVDEELSEWIRGTIIAIGADPAKTLNPNGSAKVPWKDQIYDIAPTDFRHIIDHVRLKYDQTGKNCDIYNKGSAQKVTGVRINCTGDQRALKCSVFDAFTANKSLCNVVSDLDIIIANKIGVPLVARKIPPALSWRGRKVDQMAFGECSLVMRLQVQKQWEGVKGITDPEELELARSRLSDGDGKEGSCVVVRKDGKPLDHKFLEALLDYATKVLGEAEVMGTEFGIWKDDVLDRVTKADWQKHYNKFVAQKKTISGHMSAYMPGVAGGSVPLPPNVPISNLSPSSSV